MKRTHFDNVDGFHCNVFYKASVKMHETFWKEVVSLWNIRIMIEVKDVLNKTEMFWFYVFWTLFHILENREKSSLIAPEPKACCSHHFTV
jgi:hypothetical protein